jgi:hypothetical protein
MTTTNSLQHLKIVGEDEKEFPHQIKSSGRYYILPHGVKYKVAVKNPFKVKCSCNITIDGILMGDWILPPNYSYNFERPVDRDECFTFLRVNLVQQAETLNTKGSLTDLERKDNKDILRLTPIGTGITSGKSENGLVMVEFTPEIEGSFVRNQLHSTNDRVQNNHTQKDLKSSTFDTAKYHRYSSGNFPLYVRTLMGKTICLDCSSTDLVGTLMVRLWEKEGLLPDEQRLIFGGRQLEPERSISEYRIIKESTLHLVLRLRGGCPPSVTVFVGDNSYDVPSGEVIKQLKLKIHQKTTIPCGQQQLIYEGKELQDNEPVPFFDNVRLELRVVPDTSISDEFPRLAAGATTLQGKSSQTFGESVTFHRDKSKAVSFSVRLVANADEDLSRSTVVMDTNIKPTPLKNLKRPRDPSLVEER